MTLAERLSRARVDLVAAGVADAEAAIDVDVYAREILGWDRARLLSEQREEMPARLEPRFSEWIARRLRHEPTAYIVGHREFWNLPFTVSPAVLIPRPETELIVEEVVVRLAGTTAPHIADIGTGSGCLAVSIAHEIADATVVATDISAAAVEVAHTNARLNGVESRISFVCTSYLDGVTGPFDAITCNPPYVRGRDRDALGKGIRHEPEVALFGGMDGLRDIAGVLRTAVAALKPEGWFLMEFGYGQEEDVLRLSAEVPGLQLISVKADLQGISRTAVFRRTG